MGSNAILCCAETSVRVLDRVVGTIGGCLGVSRSERALGLGLRELRSKQKTFLFDCVEKPFSG
jgi:hypothetical protein